jgi:hypothetical protein
MFIWNVIEWCLIIGTCAFVITQVIIPSIVNKPTFPLFRKTIKQKDEIEEELRNENVCLETEQLKQQVEELRKQKATLIRRRGRKLS